MPYVEYRDGVLVGVYNNQQPWAADWRDDDHPDVVRFLSPPPPPVPTVSRRQMLTGLVLSGFITEAEASSATDIPAAVAAVIDTLATEQERIVARMKWRTFQEARRDDPLVSGLAASKRMTAAQVDDLFVLAGSLQ